MEEISVEEEEEYSKPNMCVVDMYQRICNFYLPPKL